MTQTCSVLNNGIAAKPDARRDRYLVARRGRSRGGDLMAIRKLAGSTLIMGAVTALVIGGSAAPAFAATWTVHPGGAFAGRAVTTTTLTDTGVPTTISCTSSTLKGALVSGTVASGTHLGRILAASFQTCTDLANSATFTVTSTHTPWWLNAASYTSPVTIAHLVGIHLTLTNSTCSAVVDGTTSANADNGTVKIKYSNSNHDMKVVSASGNLRIYVITGCSGVFVNNDTVHYAATYAITPQQTITSP